MGAACQASQAASCARRQRCALHLQSDMDVVFFIRSACIPPVLTPVLAIVQQSHTQAGSRDGRPRYVATACCTMHTRPENAWAPLAPSLQAAQHVFFLGGGRAPRKTPPCLRVPGTKLPAAQCFSNSRGTTHVCGSPQLLPSPTSTWVCMQVAYNTRRPGCTYGGWPVSSATLSWPPTPQFTIPRVPKQRCMQ